MSSRPARRTVLRGAGVAAAAAVTAEAVTACSGDDADTPVASPGATGKDATVPADKVPVEGGYIDKDAEVVITQPSKGSYRAFSAVCTHQGCLVSQVLDGRIRCPCHGSQFSIKTGAVEAGPAPKPLPRRTVTKTGKSLEVT